MATMVGSSESTCVLSARRVNMVPRSIPRSFENIATVPTILRSDFSLWNSDQLHGSVVITKPTSHLLITSNHIQPQAGTPQRSFHSEVGVVVFGLELGKCIFRALFGSLSAGNINILHILRGIGQYCHGIGLDFGHAACHGKQLLLTSPTNFDDSILEDGKHWSMMRQNPHFTGRTRQNNNVYVALKNSAILGNDFTTNGHKRFSGVPVSGVRLNLIPDTGTPDTFLTHP